MKEVAGKLTGDSKLQSEGKGDQLKGKVQNTIGGIKDAPFAENRRQTWVADFCCG